MEKFIKIQECVNIVESFVEEKDVQTITKILNLDNLNTELELRTIRNQFVRWACDTLDTRYDDKASKLLSGVTAVIDHHIYIKGFMY